jgi:hypothetical protein
VKFWIVGSAAIVSLALAFSTHGFGGQFPGETTSGQAAGEYRISLPPGYRDWALVSVAAVGPPLNDIRAKLGNGIAMSDLRQGTIPYRDGAIIARLAWKQTTDPQTSNAFRLQGQQVGLRADTIAKLLSQSFVAGAPTNVQFMVKDSKKYASTGGWGFAQFTNGKADAIVQQSCFACHEPAKATDFVFTRYSP